MASSLLAAASMILLGAGLLLATAGLFGLLRMPNTFHQLHPAGLITGPATILILLASIGSADAAIITSAALVIIFVLITAPLSSHAVAQAAYLRRGRGRPPHRDETGTDG
jgi:multicomponent Na+:H+ antiporter subunit G